MPKPKVLFVLQNAWRKGWPAGKPWRRDSWERALWMSQTGKRLRELISPGLDYRVANSTRSVGNECQQLFQADVKYVLGEVRRFRPDLVVLLGKVAGELADELPDAQAVLRYQHPAWRVLSKEMTARWRAEILTRAHMAARGQ